MNSFSHTGHQVLRKYSDKTIARDLVRELESYGNLDGMFIRFKSHLFLFIPEFNTTESFTRLHANSRSGRRSPGSSGSESAAEAVRARKRNSRLMQNEEYIPSSEEETTTDDDDDREHGVDKDGEHSEKDHTYENGDMQQQPPRPPTHTLAQSGPSFRPPSSLSSQTLMRYRTPMAGSMMSAASGVPGGLGTSGMPPTQPMPAFATPSAFGEDSPLNSLPTIPSSGSGSLSASTYVPGAPYPAYPYTHQHILSTPLSVSTRTQSPNTASLTGGLNLIHDQNRSTLPYNTIPLPPHARYIRQYDPRSSLDDPSPPNGPNGAGGGPSAVERALENVQAHIAALSERVEMLEAVTNAHGLSRGLGGAGGSMERHASLSSSSLFPGSAHSLFFGSSFLGMNSNQVWDPTQLGLWSTLVGPLSRVVDSLRSIAAFLIYVPIEETHLASQARDRDPRFRSYSYSRRGYTSPSLSILLIIRRLILDVTFMFSFLGLVRFVWKRTGLKRRVIYNILGVVWRAIMGSERKVRVMVDRGV